MMYIYSKIVLSFVSVYAQELKPTDTIKNKGIVMEATVTFSKFGVLIWVAITITLAIAFVWFLAFNRKVNKEMEEAALEIKKRRFREFLQKTKDVANILCNLAKVFAAEVDYGAICEATLSVRSNPALGPTKKNIADTQAIFLTFLRRCSLLLRKSKKYSANEELIDTITHVLDEIQSASKAHLVDIQDFPKKLSPSKVLETQDYAPTFFRRLDECYERLDKLMPFDPKSEIMMGDTDMPDQAAEAENSADN